MRAIYSYGVALVIVLISKPAVRKALAIFIAVAAILNVGGCLSEISHEFN